MTRHLSDQDRLFLFGRVQSEPRQRETARLWRKALTDSGALAALDADLGEASAPVLSRDAVAFQVTDSRTGRQTDLVALLMSRFGEAHERDVRYEAQTDRWRRDPERTRGFIPGDAGSLRLSLMFPHLSAPCDYTRMGMEQMTIRSIQATGVAFAYLATPHFIPADLALDVVTATPPPRQARDELRLPADYVMVFHDAVPLDVLTGTDDEVDAFGAAPVLGEGTALLGALLRADPDGRPDTDSAFLLIARDGGYGIAPVFYGDHPAGRVLYNYAALLSWERWRRPPPMEQPARSRSQLRRLARSPQGRDGGLLQVRVLDYVPPPEAPAQGGGKSRRELQYRHPRRAHWRNRVRYGIRDEQGEPVGPVYGPDAVEGETFIRVRRFVRRRTVREDLPERPAQAPAVYKVGKVERG